MRLISGRYVRKAILVIALKQVSRYMASRDLVVVQSQLRILNGTTNHLIRIREVMFVMTVSASESSDRGHCIAAPARSACTLLIIGPGGGHISERYTGKRSDVDSYFHCGGTRQNIDCRTFMIPFIGAQIDVLEKQLEFFSLRKYILGLGGV